MNPNADRNDSVNYRKIINALVVPSLFTWMPTCFNTELVARPEVWILYIFGFLMIFGQPHGSCVPLASSMRSVHDRYSAIAILLVTYSVLAWAVFRFINSPPTAYDMAHYFRLGVGSFVGLLGLFLRWAAIRTLGSRFTATVQLTQGHRLATNGIFNVIRHPSYAGAVLLLISPIIFYGQWVLLPLAFVGLAVAYGIRIRAEDRMLASEFGDEFALYRRRVRAIVPWLI